MNHTHPHTHSAPTNKQTTHHTTVVASHSNNSSSSSETRMQQRTAARMWAPSSKARIGAGLPHGQRRGELGEGVVLDAGERERLAEMASYNDKEAQGPSNLRESYLG